MASRYSMAKVNMSYVEFQRVETSRGIIRPSSLRRSSSLNHSGRIKVVEFLTANENLRSYMSYSNQVNLSKSFFVSSHLNEHQSHRLHTLI